MLKIASSKIRFKPKKFNCFLLPINAIKFRAIPALLLILLASCSTTPPPSKTKAVTELDEIIISSGSLSAKQHIELAKNTSTDAATKELLTATKLLYQEKNYLRALWLADKTLPLIDEKTPNNIQESIQLVLIKTSSLQQLGYYSESHLQLNQLEQYTSQHKVPLTATYYRLLHQVYQQEKQPLRALNAQLFAFSLTTPSAQSKGDIDSIWQSLLGLSQWQLSLFSRDKAPDSKGWFQLTTLANKFGDNQKQMQYHLGMWQRKFKRHPANLIAKQLATQVISQKNIENIAVIIPLTGKQQSAGVAIQQGILASFSNEETKKLHFLDSNTVNWFDLSNKLALLKIDYVIGPILKVNVDKYITHTRTEAQNQLNTSNDLFNVPDSQISAIDQSSAISGNLQPVSDSKAIDTLLLNMPTKASLTNQQTVLSMRPEDEAQQAAVTLSRQQFQHPIVLSQQNVISKRIAQAFAKQWLRITGNSIDVVYYNTGAQMQTNIKASLSVDKSKARINQLKRSLNKSIKIQTRNRRDIDMIYLVGSPEETRLVKPYIEVNISPFAKIIPIYASSRSHSTQSDYSSNSDLQGLTFTEIPWLLAGEKNAELATLSQQLWPKRSDGLSRLFAMGFDSYQLISKIPLMQQAPYLQHWGQTGVLKLGNNKVLTRSLLWGTYHRNKVVSIVME